MISTRFAGLASCAAIANGIPTPSVPSGPGSIHVPCSGTCNTFDAWATMSPPSPMTIISSSVAMCAAISAHSLIGSIGTSSEVSCAAIFAAALSSTARSTAEKALKSTTPTASRSASRFAPTLPTSPTSAARFWPISVSSRSSCTTFASPRMDPPYFIRKSSGVPARTTTSAWASASLRLRLKNCGWFIGSWPRPIPFVNTGIFVASAKRRSAGAPSDHFKAVPAITIGRDAPATRAAASPIALCGAVPLTR